MTDLHKRFYDQAIEQGSDREEAHDFANKQMARRADRLKLKAISELKKVDPARCTKDVWDHVCEALAALEP